MSATGERHARALPDGFTLLEVLVVIAVLALITGLAFPRIERTMDNVRFASARAAVEAATYAARAEAARTNSSMVVNASRDGHSLLSNGRIVATLPSSIRLETSENAPRFFGDGSSDGGEIEVVSESARAKLLIADGNGVARWGQ
jgi:prepilin-type N-terminal cleavage/methylation domain-containing protein